MREAHPINLEGLGQAIESRAGAARLVVAVAGPPGSGKSTLADAAVERLNERAPGSAAVLPMDGYHFDDRVLIARGMRARKGAPDTFDVAGLRHMLMRLRDNNEAEIAVPVFDRDIEIARAGARMIPQTVRTIVVEGNYLLLKHAPWSSLRSAFDLTVLIRVPEAVLRERLRARWAGYNLADDAIDAKVEANDLPNGRVVLSDSIEPDYVVGS